MSGIRLALILSTWSLFTLECSGQSETTLLGGSKSETNSESKLVTPLRIRFDAAHSHTWIESVPRPGLNQYHLLASPSRAAGALVAMGCQVDVQLTAWNEESLREVDLVVLNLVSADRPAFRISEIQALGDFVARGGGFILITDHTNCYFHNHALEPLCDRLDLNLSSETACEKPPKTLSAGSGWILLDRFADHPIIKQIRHLGFQTGGTVDERFGIVWTSPSSWGDAASVPLYGEGAPMGFPGNFTQEASERVGPLAVIAAKSLARGRIVVIGDQNALGGIFLNYADNRRFWLQSVLWASGRGPELEYLIPKGLSAEPDRSLVWCVEPLESHIFYWGSTDRQGYYHAFALLNKHADARATDEEPQGADWMIIPDPKMLEQPHWQSKIQAFTQRPKKHVVIFHSNELLNANVSVTKCLAGFDSTLLETDFSRTYTLDNGSTIQLWKQPGRWSNARLLGPESTRNDSDDRWEESLLRPMWDLGLKRVKSFQELINWPEE